MASHREPKTRNRKELEFMKEGVIGEIRMYPSTVKFDNWWPCDGRKMSVSTFSPLFTILGTAYGGDGRKTFRLPKITQKKDKGSGPPIQFLICVQGADYPEGIRKN